MGAILVDGSFGEGGGQIFRNALAYAAVVGRAIKIVNIRAKRKNPGLRPQHLTVLKALAQITGAKVEGAFIGSRAVYFEPRSIRGGNYKFDVGTAGSISLVLQGLLPVLMFAEKKSIVELRGGTDVPWSPPIDAVRYVLLRGLSMMGASVQISLIRRGHYPKGGGIVRLIVEPVDKLKPIILLEQGKIEKIEGISHCVRLPKHVAERQAKSAKEFLQRKGFQAEIEIEYYEREKDPHLAPGSGIVLWTITTSNALLEGDALGAKGKPAEKVGMEAAEKLYRQIKSGGAVDVHHTDQLVVFMALADGVSRIFSSEISMHTLTAVHLAQLVIGSKIKIQGKVGERGILEVEGIGFSRN